MALEDYKDIVATVSGIISIGQMFSGTLVCKQIYDRGTSSYLPVMTFLPGYVFSLLFWEQARLIQDSAMAIVNYVGLTITAFYLTWYYVYNDSNGREEFIKKFLHATGLVGVLIAYAEFDEPDRAEYFYNLILTVIMVVLVSLPLLRIKKIVQEKNAESIPFPMVSSGMLCSGSWLLYGFIIKKNAVIYQNLFVVLMTSVQVVLYLLYPGPGIKKEEKKKD